MRINVSQQLREPIGSARSYDVDEMVDIDDSSYLVQDNVRLIRTNRGILVKGKLRTEVEVTCSRCLSFFGCPLTLNVDDEYFPIIDAVSGASLPLPDEPGCFIISEQHILDLAESIRQYVLLAMPMKPLCRQDCAGLCSVCGHDLNEGPCDCLPQQPDPRWSQLNELA